MPDNGQEAKKKKIIKLKVKSDSTAAKIASETKETTPETALPDTQPQKPVTPAPTSYEGAGVKKTQFSANKGPSPRPFTGRPAGQQGGFRPGAPGQQGGYRPGGQQGGYRPGGSSPGPASPAYAGLGELCPQQDPPASPSL